MGNLERKRLQAAFLEAFAARGVVRAAAQAAGVARSTVYEWRETDPTFGKAFADASEEANDKIREEVWHRAITGWVETTVTVETDPDGKETKRIVKRRRYSDTMLRLLAISRLPEYRDRLDITSQDGRLDMAVIFRAIVEDPIAGSLLDGLLQQLAPASALEPVASYLLEAPDRGYNLGSP